MKRVHKRKVVLEDSDEDGDVALIKQRKQVQQSSSPVDSQSAFCTLICQKRQC